MAKINKYLTYKGKTITLPNKYLVEGGREKAIQLLERYEFVNDIEVLEENPPAFVREALGI